MASPSASSFASLLRRSSFVALGDFRNKLVSGVIFTTTPNDIYVDLGLKFHAVVRKPRENSRLFVRGAKVQVKLLDYEITDRFIGTTRDVSLLEADAVLVAMLSTPVASSNKKSVNQNQR